MKSFSIQTVAIPLLVILLFFLPLGIAASVSWYAPLSSHAETAPVEPSSFSEQSISAMSSLATLATQVGVDHITLANLLGLPIGYDFSTLLVDIEEDEEYAEITVRFIRERISEYLK
jgi:hypothetical protein